MALQSVATLRLALKRAFTSYYLELQTPAVADPTEAFNAAAEYLGLLRRQLGREEFMRRLDDETTHLAGEVEQDLRRHSKRPVTTPAFDDLEERLRECFEYGLGRLRLSKP